MTGGLSDLTHYGIAGITTAGLVLAQTDVQVFGQVERLGVIGIMAFGCWWLARKNTEREKEIKALNEARHSESKEVSERLIKALTDSNEIGRWCREHGAGKK